VVAARGDWGTVEWAVDGRDSMPAREFYEDLDDKDKAKIQALFQRLAEHGEIRNREKFRQLGKKAGPEGRDLWEFKSFQIRFLGDFRPGKRFVVAHGLRKKRDDLPKADIYRAVRILAEPDERERRK